MPLIKLSRINKGGEIVVTATIFYSIEIESKAHDRLTYRQTCSSSVEEPLDSIAVKIEMLETAGSRTPFSKRLIPK